MQTRLEELNVISSDVTCDGIIPIVENCLRLRKTDA